MLLKFLFERGQFDSNATKMVTIALIFLSVSIIPYIFRDSLTRIYFAFNDSKTPFYIALSSVLTKVIFKFYICETIGYWRYNFINIFRYPN